jgi:hypothetical protein
MPDECTSTPTTFSCAADLPTLFRYIRASKVATVYLRSRLNPWYKHRQVLVQEFARPLSRQRQDFYVVRVNALGGDNFWYLPETLPPEEVRRRTRRILDEDRDRMQHFLIAPAADRATHELFQLCRDEGIEVAVVLMPESTAYRALYSPETERTVSRYVQALERTWQVPVIDARSWVSDEGFSDCNHMFRAAALPFTRRLAAEVLQPLADGRLDATAGRRDVASGSH